MEKAQMTTTRSFSRGTPRSFAWSPDTNRFHTRDLFRHLHPLKPVCFHPTTGPARHPIVITIITAPLVIDPNFCRNFSDSSMAMHQYSNDPAEWTLLTINGESFVCAIGRIPIRRPKIMCLIPKILRLPSSSQAKV